MKKRVENFDNLQKIASSALMIANKEKVELRAQVDELAAEVDNLKLQLNRARKVVVNNYIANF